MTPKKDGVCYAVGPNTILKSIDHGSHWDHVATPRPLPQSELKFEHKQARCGYGSETLSLTNISQFTRSVVDVNLAITVDDGEIELQTKECHLSALNPTCTVKYSSMCYPGFQAEISASANGYEPAKLEIRKYPR